LLSIETKNRSGIDHNTVTELMVEILTVYEKKKTFIVINPNHIVDLLSEQFKYQN